MQQAWPPWPAVSPSKGFGLALPCPAVESLALRSRFNRSLIESQLAYHKSVINLQSCSAKYPGGWNHPTSARCTVQHREVFVRPKFMEATAYHVPYVNWPSLVFATPAVDICEPLPKNGVCVYAHYKYIYIYRERERMVTHPLLGILTMGM